MHVVLEVLALVFFVMAGFKLAEGSRFNFVGLGLFCWLLAYTIWT
jgi:hypothetical protein